LTEGKRFEDAERELSAIREKQSTIIKKAKEKGR
jgi:hypothetical protein